MNKNLRIMIVFAALVIASQWLAAAQRENTPPETYVYRNIYFEYPADWKVTLNETE